MTYCDLNKLNLA